KEGNGHVYVDTWPLTKIDTQASARIAKRVACDILYLDCSNYDFFYTIRSDAQTVGGPSGGAAVTVATIAALLDLDISGKVMMTGTINLDGSIGQVSGILEKVEAVAKKGNTFLIPYKQSVITLKTSEKTKYPVTENETSEIIDVKEYAKEHFNLTVAEVKTIKEAFMHFTNYKIKEPELEFQKTQEYQGIMRKLADELINKSAKLKETCEKKLETTKISYKYQKQVTKFCELSMDETMQSYEKEDYYSGASLAFSGTISYLQGINLIDLMESEDKKTFLFDYLKNVEGKIFKANTSNIELYAVTEERLSEAAENLELAWKNYYNGDYVQGVYYGSFADARLYTAELWNRYADQFPVYIKRESGELKEIANEIISDSQAIFTYSSLSSSGVFLDRAKDFLDTAQDNYKKGNYYSAIILGLKSGANAELASEVSDDIDHLIELRRKKALIYLNRTKSVTGQSYFEYADTLRESNKPASLTYFTYAEKLSRLNEILNKDVEMKEIKPGVYIEPVTCDGWEYFPVFFVCFILGLSGGIFIGKL
ncbi:MAG: hypothetical protein KAU95_00255, partial [Candidatus Aenigmarchaeota archaeon]|nr:hypothetical protein [Candidatus Aenigmarchaeota archaeon]